METKILQVQWERERGVVQRGWGPYFGMQLKLGVHGIGIYRTCTTAIEPTLEDQRGQNPQGTPGSPTRRLIRIPGARCRILYAEGVGANSRVVRSAHPGGGANRQDHFPLPSPNNESPKTTGYRLKNAI